MKSMIHKKNNVYIILIERNIKMIFLPDLTSLGAFG